MLAVAIVICFNSSCLVNGIITTYTNGYKIKKKKKKNRRRCRTNHFKLYRNVEGKKKTNKTHNLETEWKIEQL